MIWYTVLSRATGGPSSRQGLQERSIKSRALFELSAVVKRPIDKTKFNSKKVATVNTIDHR